MVRYGAGWDGPPPETAAAVLRHNAQENKRVRRERITRTCHTLRTSSTPVRYLHLHVQLSSFFATTQQSHRTIAIRSASETLSTLCKVQNRAKLRGEMTII